jgi:hypothetical protein
VRPKILRRKNRIEESSDKQRFFAALHEESATPAGGRRAGGYRGGAVAMKRRWPLRAWLAACVLGAILGLFAFVVQLGSVQSGPIFLAVLPHPALYWPYPVFGLVIAALVLFLAAAIRSSN